METIALSAMVLSLIILLLFSHSIENVMCCSNVHSYLVHVDTMSLFMTR